MYLVPTPNRMFLFYFEFFFFTYLTFSRLGTDFSIGYGTGGASGVAYTDTVTIGDATVKSQIIGAANSTTGFNLVKPIDGIRKFVLRAFFKLR